ncbi:MAG: phospho-N-acetylmuramoyl-pentapeptide-transferase [Thermotogaceae bacterium]|nr:phospho-N-acetylmuramoyl-pentapeptide-transferase [Thermotogaceae bacterium]
MMYLIEFLIILFLLWVYIRYASRKGIGQLIKKDGPDLHGYKEGTPTMGGVIFISVAAVFMVAIKVDPFLIASMVVFMMLGLWDDMTSIIKKDAYGMKARHKFALQIVISAALLWLFSPETVTFIPFYGKVNPGFWYYVFAVFVMVGTVNAVNITDGLDGLAGFVSVSSLLSMYIFLLLKGHEENSIMILLFAIFAFLIFNSKPAKVFMGDTGSLAIGGFISALAIKYHFEFYLIFFGFIFVIETLSVIIQVASYKIREKRVFKMAPIHHHFELSGWQESKIVFVFTVLNFVSSLIVLR